jgi:hypothetical protein
MVVKINNKPMQVKEDEDNLFSPTYIAVSSFGTLSMLWLFDHVCRLFVYESPFPWMHDAVEFLAGVIQWFL